MRQAALFAQTFVIAYVSLKFNQILNTQFCESGKDTDCIPSNWKIIQTLRVDAKLTSFVSTNKPSTMNFYQNTIHEHFTIRWIIERYCILLQCMLASAVMISGKNLLGNFLLFLRFEIGLMMKM